MVIIELIYNLAILVSFSVISGFIETRFDRKTRAGQILQGLLFGSAAAISILYPYILMEGIIIDGRSVVISTGALFFGPITGIITALLSIIARIYVGGSATLTGILVIMSSLTIGLAFNLVVNRSGSRTRFSTSMLFSLGLIVHFTMIAILVLMLPGNSNRLFVEQIAFTVIVFYPAATVLIGKILSDQFQNKELIREISERLEEKNILLSEVHHRVKNNLSIISGLLSLQIEPIQDPSAKQILAETDSRIRSISLIHELIYNNEFFNSIPLGGFIEKLVYYLDSLYYTDLRSVNTIVDTDDIHIDLNHAIPCALIVNELVTNCFKHAFGGLHDGTIHITGRIQDGDIEITVTDDGEKPININKLEDGSSLGMSIIRGLADQINGEIRFQPVNPGLRATLRFRQNPISK